MHEGTFDEQFADEAAKLCFDKFDRLPKSGKPTDFEWTLLAAIIKYDSNKLEVVSLATGSKCVGITKLTAQGDVVHDSHAEVILYQFLLVYTFFSHPEKNFTLLFAFLCSRF